MRGEGGRREEADREEEMEGGQGREMEGVMRRGEESDGGNE